MAARKKKRKKKRKTGGKCQIVTVCGKRRRICRTAKGRIKSNTAAGGGKGRKRKAAKGKKRKGRCLKWSKGRTRCLRRAA